MFFSRLPKQSGWDDGNTFHEYSQGDLGRQFSRPFFPILQDGLIFVAQNNKAETDTTCINSQPIENAKGGAVRESVLPSNNRAIRSFKTRVQLFNFDQLSIWLLEQIDGPSITICMAKEGALYEEGQCQFFRCGHRWAHATNGSLRFCRA